MSLFLIYLFLIKVTISVVIDHVVEPKGWIEIGRSDPNDPINLVFAVKQRNVDILEKLLLAKSSPDNDEYGNWMTVSDIQTLVAPSEESLAAIEKWLVSNGFDETLILAETSNSDVISINTTIGKVESLLKCEYYDYMNSQKNDLIVSRVKMGTNYEVDENVASHLDFITPTKRFPPLSTLKVRTQLGFTAVTPVFLRALYNVNDTKGQSSSNSQGVASFQEEYYDMSDLKAFWKEYDISSTQITDVPSNTSSGYGLEAELDTQYITSMGEKIPLQVWYYAANYNFGDALLNWVVAVLADEDSPHLFSVSYGENESEMGASYATRLNTEFAKMGTAGKTIFFAAGDSGAGGGCSDADGDVFLPDFPASSPYVTAVGGVYSGKVGKSPIGEKVWVDGGGGFSNIFPRQSWQSTAIASYLSTNENLPGSAYYNATGRGYPDISAQSVDFVILVDDEYQAVDGTSCACPTAAGIFALLNDLRLQYKMTTLGFLNPLIYKLGSNSSNAFNDVTSGYNVGCSDTVTTGFYASSGWDPASGYGSPNYAGLVPYVLETGMKTLKYGARFQKQND